MSIEQAKVERFVGTLVDDLGATVSSTLALLGHRLGLYRELARAGPLTPAELAARTGTHERYVREWLNNQAAGGYVEYDPDAGTYTLPREHAMVLADEDSPVYMASAWEQMAAIWVVAPKLEAAFVSGEGVAWGEQDPRLFPATAGFFEPAYRANLTDAWIPALDGVEPRLAAGAQVADVGCGHGASAILLAQAFPNVAVTGFDDHGPSTDTARQQAADAGVDGRVTFEVADARTYPAPDDGYGLICFFDALHDFGDPLGAAERARESLADDGAVMLVEIRAEDRTEDNLTPFGRLGYGMSTCLCTPNALGQDGGYALGGQAGPAAIREIFETAGFTRFRTAAETPVHRVMEARR